MNPLRWSPTRRPWLGPASALVAVAALAAACTSGTSPAATTTTSTITPDSSGTVPPSAPPSGPASAATLQQAFVAVVGKVLPSVVQITTSSGLGSGIVYDTKGDIVTNDHVVGSDTSFQVQLPSGGASLAATLVGAYPPDDLAVIKVSPGPALHPATFADSARLEVGDIVLAIGNPLGLSSSVTEGIVSATGRTVVEPSQPPSPMGTIANAIQTSAAINPGNSGGALVDLTAQVVGVPTLAAVDSQIGGAAAGIGFAIPSNTVRDIAGQIIANGHVVNSHRAALGIGALQLYSGFGQPAGVGVASLGAASPAGKAGIRPGDVITAINGQPVRTASDLDRILAQLSPGQVAKVAVIRPDGSKATVAVTLGTLPGSAG